jgi:CAP-Gly domain-containing linker protein 1
MSTTPSKARQSGIPTPGRASGIPTPGRSRSSSSANQYPALPSSDVEYMSRAFADALKANDPAHHRSTRVSDVSSSRTSPPYPPLSSQSGRRSVAGRPSSVASSSSAAGHTPYRALTERSKTPTGLRSLSRQSDVSGRSSSRTGRTFEVGDNVRIESLGYEGTLKYMGAIDGKSGLWAGVELSGGFAGKGKNNGTVNG